MKINKLLLALLGITTVVVAGCNGGSSANTIGNNNGISTTAIANQVNSYDFGPTISNRFGGSFVIAVNPGSSAINTIVFVSNAIFNIESTTCYGNLVNANLQVESTSLTNGDIQYTLTYTKPLSVTGQGTITIPYSPDIPKLELL